MENFYPSQYSQDSEFGLNHNYLSDQFKDCDTILEKIRSVVSRNDFTLGSAVNKLEDSISQLCNTKHAIGVGSGTDALFLSLKALGIGTGDEVITSTYTFYATVGAIATSGATPILCDCKLDFNIDEEKIEHLITDKTKAIIPVHWSGRPCEMDKIRAIAEKHDLYVVEDACHALNAEYKGARCGSLGDTGCFSFHPLKNLNVWGDGGIITTNDSELANRLKLIRNHGLLDRNTCVEFAYNSRLDTIQAVVAQHVLDNKFDNITDSRIANAFLLDNELKELPSLRTIDRRLDLKEVFHLYMFCYPDRDELVAALKSKGIDAKIHYPVPMHLQPAASRYGYKAGDFPVAESLAKTCISLPVHEFITQEQVYYMASIVKEYANG